MKILSVIPFASIPISVLQYSVPSSKEFPKQFSFGSIVAIPLRGRKIFGVVIDEKEENEHTSIPTYLKPILGLYQVAPLFGKDTLLFLEKIALWYHTPLSKIVTIAFPQAPKKKIAFDFSFYEKKITHSAESPKFFLFNEKERLKKEYETLIRAALEKGNRVLFLVPRKEEGEKIFRFFHTIHSDTVFLDATQNPALLFHRYSQFFSGSIPILIGTRKFFFWDSVAPLTVILHHTHDTAWKDPRNPYFDARILFHIMAKMQNPRRELIASGVMEPLEFQIQKIWRRVDLRFSRNVPIEFVRPSDDYSHQSIFIDATLRETFFNAWENAYTRLLQKKASLPDEALLSIATENPEHFVLQSFLKNADDLFFSQELACRKKFHYPPNGKILKITVQKEKEYRFISEICVEKNIKILGNTFSQKKKQILVLFFEKKIEEDLFEEMQKKKIFAKIDINPLSLI